MGGPFGGHFRKCFGVIFNTVFDGTLDAIVFIKSGSDNGRFFDDLWNALGDRLERILGSFGVLFGGPLFQIHSEKQYRTHVFKNASLRNLGSLGLLSGPVLSHFKEVLDPQMDPKLVKNKRKRSSVNEHVSEPISNQFLGLFPGPKWRAKAPTLPVQRPRWTKIGQDGQKCPNTLPK